ncbi:MAG: right-handed parallel beta-helix repeat-containing protein [Bacteroidales bacterium]
MKKIFPTIAAIILMYSFSSAQTTIPGGNVSGTWTFAGSPYLIQGAIMIPNDSTLTIEPGVTVNFQGCYKLYLLGRLLAIGIIADTITFTAANITNGWKGIRFDNTTNNNDTSKIYYCKFKYGKATGSVPDTYGGALYFSNFSKCVISNCLISNNTASSGGGILCDNSSPIILNNTISYNTASQGGGITCYASSNPQISNNIISNNTTSDIGGGIRCASSSPIITDNVIINNISNYGGGIDCAGSNPSIKNNFISNNTGNMGGGIYFGYSSTPTIINNIFSNNTASSGGGIYSNGSSKPTFINNTIVNNNATSGGALYCNVDSDPIFRNTILYGNTASSSGSQVFLFDEPSDPDFYYCDVQGGSSSFGLNGVFYTGIYQNNIDTNSLFVTPSAGSGTGYNGIIADWSLQAGSPCIDAGTPDLTGLNLPVIDIANNPRVSGCRIDIGAYEFQSTTPMTLIINSTNSSCLTCNDGIATVTVSGGTAPYSYYWNTVPPQDTSTAIGLLPGEYTVIITDSNGCTLIASVEVSYTASINEVLNTFSMDIYPNPANDNLTIKVPQKSEIEILNIQGQIIKTINNDGTEITIDLQNLSSGVYIIKAKTDKGIAVKKFIKE